MENFRKQVRIGIVNTSSVFATIKYEDGKLSISGAERPNSHGGARSCGQIDMSIQAKHFSSFAPNWNLLLALQFFKIWGKWHLNDMQSGTEKQMKFLKDNNLHNEDYETACKALKDADLYIDKEHDNYKYGSAWLTTTVPENVLQFLYTLPMLDKPHPWGTTA